MPQITLIRHAETIYNAKKIFCGRIDCDLSEKGRIDTLNTLHYQTTDFDIYFCSPLKRTMQTIQLAVLGVTNVIIDKRLTEISIGDWEGKPKDNFPQNLVNDYRIGIYTPPNAEPTSSVDQRVIEFITDLFKKYDDKTKILVVTHNGIMRSVKRNFVPEYENIMSNNLGSIILDRNNYTYYLNRQQNKTPNNGKFQ